MMSSWWIKAYFFLIQIPIKLLVKSKPIPTDPISELKLDLTNPVLYILPYNSKIDLLVVRSLCKKYHLPDPLKPTKINGIDYASVIYVDRGIGLFSSEKQELESINILKQYISAYQADNSLTIQLVPVSVMFGRRPDIEGKKSSSLPRVRGIHKFFKMIISGRDCYTRFSYPVLLNNLKLDLQQDLVITANKFRRIVRIHFLRQRAATIGPKLPLRQKMFNRLLNNTSLSEAVAEEAKSKNISIAKAQDNALDMLNEIAASFSHRMLRITDFVLTWAWNRLYQGLKITNAESVRDLAKKGHEIIYAPCHRSHMDYLLLSYVLYRQGMVPPHIAAGINLNFWPAGPIFRHLGAFFIRRSFRGNKLYTSVFREYLAELFIRGYSVEYFVEGGRSRTGRLLDPKTGMLMMTIQTLLRGDARPITVVPVYIGYEHVLEVATYANELRGAAKQKENLWHTIKAFLKLKKLGYGYVNFGEPISLNHFLNQQVPEWREAINPEGAQRPSWLTPTANLLGKTIMERINASAAINPMNLCCSILLSANQHALSKKRLLAYLSATLLFLKKVPYSDLMTLPDITAEEILDHAMQMGKFVIIEDKVGEIISLSPEQTILMTYYRNNIQHLFIIPTIIIRMFMKHQIISRETLISQLKQLYPFIRSELFLQHDEAELLVYINKILTAFIEMNIIRESAEGIKLVYPKTHDLALFSASSREILQRYFIVFSLLNNNPSQSRSELEKQGRLIAERLSVLNGINAPEFFDKAVFSTLVVSLREQGYLDDKDGKNIEPIKAMNAILYPLINAQVIQTIEEISIS